MIDAQRLRRIAMLGLPIIGGMVSQNVLNLVDTAMVGALNDNAALGAVGLGGFATFMCMALVLGISTGVQATASRRKGEGRHSVTAKPLNAGLLIVLLVAPPASILLYFLVPWFYPYLVADPEVIRQGVPYLQVRVLAMVFVGANYAFRGYWNGVDMAKLYMSTLILMHSVNIFLNWVLIFGNLGAPALGVTGAGLATALSTAVGTAVYVYFGFRYATQSGFLHGLPSRVEVGRLVRLSLPSGIQQLFFSAGFTATFWIIGLVGTAELAAATVLINVTLVAVLPGMGLGLSAATLVGQALGRKDVEDASQWGWDVTKVAMVLLAVLGLPMILVPDLIFWVFVDDPAAIAVGVMPMRVVGATMAMEAMGLVFMHALMGAGDVRRVMVVAIAMQWAVFLPLAMVVGPVLGFGLLGIWALQGLTRSIQGVFFWRFWVGRKWAEIAV